MNIPIKQTLFVTTLVRVCSRRYMTGTLMIRRKTPHNQSFVFVYRGIHGELVDKDDPRNGYILLISRIVLYFQKSYNYIIMRATVQVENVISFFYLLTLSKLLVLQYICTLTRVMRQNIYFCNKSEEWTIIRKAHCRKLILKYTRPGDAFRFLFQMTNWSVKQNVVILNHRSNLQHKAARQTGLEQSMR